MTNIEPATPESVWALLRELTIKQVGDTVVMNDKHLKVF